MKKAIVSDREILSQTANGDKSSFKILFDQNYSTISRVLMQFSKDPEQIKDWTQEIFMNLWLARHSQNFTEIENIKAYIIVMARNHAIRALGKKSLLITYAYQESAAEEKADSDSMRAMEEMELMKAYQAVVAKLPPKTQQAYLLSREDGLTYTKVAQVMGVSVKTVENQIARALAILRQELSYLF
ncbi:RNA polymerase sigma factor [Dyadobacter tibetensis]|uniref:RNA polymerase sigma factor n=1 Tax=Dyadobacter tibetensis TaxID=1211851 RepID=UPI000471F75C|nr:sigma-70 family RNA polymerase sigma factor [Dyadobacter tibetensis]